MRDLAGGRVIERRGGLIPVNGVLRRIANQRGLLVGDAAGAVSPLTAGGLDGAMRLSSFAAEVTAAYLEQNDASILREYDGRRFQTRFLARRWMRRLLRVAINPLVTEIAFAAMMTPPLRAFARHVFFSRGGSFPEVDRRAADALSASVVRTAFTTESSQRTKPLHERRLIVFFRDARGVHTILGPNLSDRA